MIIKIVVHISTFDLIHHYIYSSNVDNYFNNHDYKNQAHNPRLGAASFAANPAPQPEHRLSGNQSPT